MGGGGEGWGGGGRRMEGEKDGRGGGEVSLTSCFKNYHTTFCCMLNCKLIVAIT